MDLIPILYVAFSITILAMLAVILNLWTPVRNMGKRMKRAELDGAIYVLSVYCHELNQPLQAILTTAELLAHSQNVDVIALREKLESIQEETVRLGSVTKQMLDELQTKREERFLLL